MLRLVRPEQMDDPAAPREELRSALAFIRWVNRVLGGRSALVTHLAAWSARWPKDRPVTLVDLGTGSADLPVAARRWALSRGFDLRVTAVDNHPTTLELAREYLAAQPLEVRSGIELVHAEALTLTERYHFGTFDYAHAGMFLHHLDTIGVLTALRVMDRLARAGIVWNDLLRTRAASAGIWALTVGQNRMVRHDARGSVRAGFTRDEVLDAARRVDLGYTRYRASILTQRFTLAGEKPHAW